MIQRFWRSIKRTGYSIALAEILLASMPLNARSDAVAIPSNQIVLVMSKHENMEFLCNREIYTGEPHHFINDSHILIKQETQASNLWVWNLDNNSPRKPVAPFRKLDLSDFCRYISDSNDVFEGNGNYRVTDRWKSIAQGGSEIDFPDTDKHLQAYARGITEMELLSPKNATANTQLILVIHEGARPVVDVFILPKSDFPLIPGSLVPLIP